MLLIFFSRHVVGAIQVEAEVHVLLAQMLFVYFVDELDAARGRAAATVQILRIVHASVISLRHLKKARVDQQRILSWWRAILNR